MFFKKQKPPEQRPRRASPATPSASRSPLYSYHASRSQRQEILGRVAPDQAAAIKQWRERLRWLGSVPRMVVLIAMFLVMGALLRLDPHATVVPLEQAKGRIFLRSLQTYESAIQEVFATSCLNANKLTVNAAQISNDIKRQFPELKTVAISLPLSGSRPVVYVQPAIPALVVSTANGTFVVDTSGKALITGNQVPGLDKLKLPVITDESGLRFSTGSMVLPERSVAFITEVVSQFKAKGVGVSSLELPRETGELRVRVEGNAYYGKFNLYGDAREEAGVFLAVRQKLAADKNTPQEYIDVRVPNRAYHK